MSCLRTQASLVALFCALLFSPSPFAERASAQEYNPNTINIPPGSYSQTCNSLSVTGGKDQSKWVLHARCKNEQGSYVSASLSGYYGCWNNNARIVNTNGVLQCLPPPGSYLQTCQSAFMTYPNPPNVPAPIQPANGSYVSIPAPGGEQLSAFCKTESGSWVQAFYSTTDICLTDIKNVNGQIFCVIPSGSYQQNCQAAHMRDQANQYNGSSELWAICVKNDGHSLQLSELGEPFLCTGSGFNISNDNGTLTCNYPTPQGNEVRSGPSGGNAIIGNGYSCGPEGANLPGCTSN